MDKEIFVKVQKVVLVDGRLEDMIRAFSMRLQCAVVLAVLAITAAAAPYVYAAQGVDEAMMSVRSPEDIARFFHQEFTYTMTLPDRAHTPEETMEAHSGDCEDFAILASAMLTRLGVESQVLVIKFKDLRVAHAVCIWKNRDGFYNFISNRELQRTGQRTIKGAIRKFYPDCDAIATIDPQTCARNSGTSEITAAKSYHGADLMADLDPRISADI